MPRTVVQFVHDILREVRGQATPLEARQGLQDALNYVDAKTNWEFLLKEKILNIQETYSTGTVSVTAGTTTVTGTGTVWSTGWQYKTIRFGDRQMPYAIASFGSGTSLTLDSALSGSSNITGGNYLIYQKRYALPTDCEPGRDLFLRGPRSVGRGGVIHKKGRMSFEDYADPMYVGTPTCYTDDEYDEVNNVATIRIDPYPTRAEEYKVVYYKKLTVPTADSARVMIPEAFETLLIKLAASAIKQRNNHQGWLALTAQAEEMLRALYNRFGASPAYEDILEVMDARDSIGPHAESGLLYSGYYN